MKNFARNGHCEAREFVVIARSVSDACPPVVWREAISCIARLLRSPFGLPRNDRGVSTLAALLVLLSLVAMGAVVAYFATLGATGHLNAYESAQAFYVTQAGIEYGVKQIYEGLSEKVPPPGISFADGSFTVSRSGMTLTVTGTVGGAQRSHQVDSPTEADCTEIDPSNLNVQKAGKRISQITFRKICLAQTTLTMLRMSWAPNSGQRLLRFRVEESSLYNDPVGVPSGTLVDVADYVINGPFNNVINYIDWDASVDDTLMTMEFTMGDNTLKTETFEVDD